MSEDLLKINNVSLRPVEDLIGVCFCGDDLAVFENPNRPGQKYQGITRSGAATIVHRLWFMGYDLVQRKPLKDQERP